VGPRGRVVASTRTEDRRFSVVEFDGGTRFLAIGPSAPPDAIGATVEVRMRSDGTFALIAPDDPVSL
jgi:hypothetical protein